MSDRPSYLRAAFLNVYNLSLFGGAVVAGLLTGDTLLAVGAAGAEVLWLLFGPDLKPFQRAVNHAHAKAEEQAEEARVKALMENLPEREWQRAKALFDLKKEIERDMQQNPSFQAILLQNEIAKLAQLHASFVALGNACVRAESYLSVTSRNDLLRQVEVQKNVEKTSRDAAAQEIARKNVQVIEKRLATMEEIQNFLARARGQMNLIENSVRLLRDQVLTMQSPDQLGEQLDDLLTGVDAVQASVKDHEAIFERVAPIAAETETEPPARSAIRSR